MRTILDGGKAAHHGGAAVFRGAIDLEIPATLLEHRGQRKGADPRKIR